MFYIIIKIILCSSLLIAIYHLLLEKEKMYGFNRFFLLFSIVFSYSVPFLTITTGEAIPTKSPQLIFEETTQQVLSLSPKQETFNWTPILWIIYGSITFFFLVRALLTILKIQNIKGNKQYHEQYKIVVTENNFSPFTFWKTIYLGKNYLINGQIDSRILLHEKAHLDQKHSWDLLFIEICKAITWFNPAIYFYKRAVITNHEFLADECVLENNFNVKEYQNLILTEIIGTQKLEFTHSFNFNNTKKRFIMMNTKRSKFIGLKKAVSIPILVTAFALFVQKTYANNPLSNNDPTANTAKEAGASLFTGTLQKMVSEKKKIFDQKAVFDTVHPTKKMTAKKPKKNDKPLPPPPPPIEDRKARNINNQQNTNVPAPPPPSSSFVQAKFPQGNDELRNRVSQNFDGSVFKGNEGLVKSTAYISIKADGTVDKITTSGDNKVFNNEIYRTLKSVTENVKWEPATDNGQPTATVFKLPMTMSFENGKK
ncbi:hypothetical protein CEY12_13745 [Chryseobacterium sp. T16E-39]|uniref:M56 family metallopeptidase n=1 Tax=Chryseobacterium sp. T16E-39 TaxID=2015076 RepID=UPI000B5B1CCF|nr:M56 family metallopeptidase [Chryseobacterium sp. T16E-39]ASK31104.1 hypothetical protein CEY12_13745 [Chryseobacterium sp. T16E-39]